MTRETLIFRELGRPPKPGEWYRPSFSETWIARRLGADHEDSTYANCRGYSCEVSEEPTE